MKLQILHFNSINNSSKLLGVIIFILILCSGKVLGQIQPDQIGFPPDSTQIWVLGSDTILSNSTFGRGIWYNVNSIIDSLVPISTLKAATGTNTINNGNLMQEWQWNSLAGGTGLKLSSSSGSAASNTQKLFEVGLSGTNVSSSQITYAGHITNTRNGNGFNYGLYINADGGNQNYGIYVDATTQAVTGVSTGTGTGVRGHTNTGSALYGTCQGAGFGVYATTQNGVPIKGENTWTSTNTVLPILQLSRIVSTGSGVNGIGGSIEWNNETSDGNTYLSNEIISKWSNATFSSRTSQFLISGVNNTTRSELFTLSGHGALKLNKYGSGNFTGTATKWLAVDASGNIIEEAPPGGGSGGATWGSITGTLSSQTDLQTALNLKLNISDTAAMLSHYLDRSSTETIYGAKTFASKVFAELPTEQLRLGYNGSNYIKATVSSDGGLTFDAVGSTPRFVFSDQLWGVSTGAFSPSWESSQLIPIQGDMYDTFNNFENALNLKADGHNAALTGTPTAPTAALNTNTTQLATTAYVDTKTWTARLASDHAISSTTATEVACGTNTLTAGTYIFTYYILAQSATTSVSPMFGINFTGAALVKSFKLRYTGTGTTAITGVADNVGATSGQIEESVSQNTYSTSAPNMGATGGVATTGTNILYIIEGLIIVTATGDLELYHGSETNTSTTVKAGTSLVLTKTN